MANESKFLDTLRTVTIMEETLSEFVEVKDRAFEVFGNWISLEEISQRYVTWKTLLSWNKLHPNSPCRLKLKLYLVQVREKFDEIAFARINREEFAASFEEFRDDVESYENELEEKLSKKRQELGQLYDEFAKQTGELQFIFEAPCVKETIMNKLLRPQTVEEEE